MPGDWLKLYRKLRYSAAWNTGEPYTRGQAWVDLLMAANYTDKTLFVRGVSVPIKRGQVGESTVTLAAKWNRSRGWVTRFLEWLETEQQIVQQKNNVTSIITILNYDDYQCTETADGTASDTADGQQTVQQTGATKKDNNKQQSQDNPPLPPAGENGDGRKPRKRKKPEPLPPLPDTLSEMAEDWAKWVQFRKEKRAPVTPTMAAAQFKQFEEWGVPRARAAITHTIIKGWQGLKEPDDDRSRSSQPGGRGGSHRTDSPARIRGTQPG